MADRLQQTGAGSLDSHPDFPDFLQQAQEQVWGEYAPRLERAVAGGNTADAERIQSQVDREARRRAVVSVRSMLNNGMTGLHRPDTLTGQEGNPTPPDLPSADALMQGIRGMDAPPIDMGPIDYAAPTNTGTQPQQTARTGFHNPAADRLAAWGVEQGGMVGDVAGGVAQGMENVGRFAGEASGLLPAERSYHSFEQGDVAGGVANAAQAALPYAAGPAAGPVGRGLDALGRTLARPAVGIPLATAGSVAGTTAQTQAPNSQAVTPGMDDAGQLSALNGQLANWQDQLKTLQAQRKQAADAMEAQQRGTGGARPGFGPIFKAQQENLQSIDDQIKAANKNIGDTTTAQTVVRNRMTPEYQAMLRQVKDAQDVRNRMTADSAKPFRDEFPTLSRTWMLAPVIAGAFVGGRAVTQAVAQRGQAGRWWEAVNSARDTSLSAAERARALVRAEELERNMPVHTWRQALTHSGPLIAAGTLGAGVSNVPEFYDLFTLDKVNPERRAYEEYMKLLPNDHPEVKRTINLLKDMPKDNPYYEAALKHFMTIKPFIVKAVEGALEGVAGAEIMAAGGKLISPAEATLPRAETRALLRTDSTTVPPVDIPPPRPPQAPVLSTLDNQPPRRPGALEPSPPPPASAVPPPSPQEILRRRYNQGPLGERGHWVDPAAPPTNGEAWVSPQGNRMWTRDREGNFRDDRGALVRDKNGRLVTDPLKVRPNWRRISSVDDIMWSGYPVG